MKSIPKGAPYQGDLVKLEGYEEEYIVLAPFSTHYSRLVGARSWGTMAEDVHRNSLLLTRERDLLLSLHGMSLLDIIPEMERPVRRNNVTLAAVCLTDKELPAYIIDKSNLVWICKGPTKEDLEETP